MNKQINTVFTFEEIQDMRKEVMMNALEGPFDYIYSIDELSDQVEGHDGKSLMRIFGGGDFNVNEEWFKFNNEGQLVTIPHIDYVQKLEEESYIVYQEYADLNRQDRLTDYKNYTGRWEEAQYNKIDRELARLFSQLKGLQRAPSALTIGEYTKEGTLARKVLVDLIKEGR